MLFCDKVDKRDIRIRFYEIGAGETVVWEDLAEFQPNNVHKQVAIAFRSPKYKTEDIDGPVNVLIRLETISGNTVSNAIQFQYVPAASIELATNTKKRKIDNSKALYEYLERHDIDYRQRTKMKRHIDPNGLGAENIAPDNSNIIPSNFFASNNNLLPAQPQRYDSFRTQIEHEQQFEQQPDHQFQQFEAQKSDYQWPTFQQSQPLHNIQPQQVYQKQFEKPTQFEQYHQPQYHPAVYSDLKIEPSCGNYMPQFSQPNYTTDVVGNAYGANGGNLSSNNFSNFGGRQSQPIASYQSPNADACPMQMTYDGPTHQSCQQIGPVYAYDKVIIQQFVSNNHSFNQQQQKAADVQNVGGGVGVNSDLSLL